MQFSISTVTPVYNGSKYLGGLVDALNIFKDNLVNTELQLIECIFVVDEAIDNSLEVLISLSEKFEFVKVIELSKNFGQHQATIAGILHSSGDWVVTLDEDLQHHPKYILNLLKQVLAESSDVCYANAIEQTHQSIIRDKVSIQFKKIMSWITGNQNIKYFNSFRIIRGEIARATASVCAPNTYFDIALSWFTKRVVNLKVDMYDQRNATKETKSGYSIFGLVKHAKVMITSTKMKFLRIGLLVGLFSFLCSILFSTYAIYRKFNNLVVEDANGWASIIISIFFFGSIGILLSGVIIETVSELILKNKGLPTFFTVSRVKDKDLIKIVNELL